MTKEGVKFATTGDIGAANVICRQNTHSDKPEEQTIIDMNEPVRCVCARARAFVHAQQLRQQQARCHAVAHAPTCVCSAPPPSDPRAAASPLRCGTSHRSPKPAAYPPRW